MVGSFIRPVPMKRPRWLTEAETRAARARDAEAERDARDAGCGAAQAAAPTDETEAPVTRLPHDGAAFDESNEHE